MKTNREIITIGEIVNSLKEHLVRALDNVDYKDAEQISKVIRILHPLAEQEVFQVDLRSNNGKN